MDIFKKVLISDLNKFMGQSIKFTIYARIKQHS